MPRFRQSNIDDARQRIELSKIAKSVANKLQSRRRKDAANQNYMNIVQNSFPLRTRLNGKTQQYNVDNSFNNVISRRKQIQTRLGNKSDRFFNRRATATPQNIQQYLRQNQIDNTFENLVVTASNDQIQRRGTLNRIYSNQNRPNIISQIIPYKSRFKIDRRNNVPGQRGVVYRPVQQNTSRASVLGRNGNRFKSTFLSAMQDVENSRMNVGEVIVIENDEDVVMTDVDQPQQQPSIFSRLSAGPSKRTDETTPKTQGFKVSVSNLNSTVSEGDLRELFGSIGTINEARLTNKPGQAFATFVRLQDAERAISEYNNRELDGMPMKLILVDAGTSKKPTGTMATDVESQTMPAQSKILRLKTVTTTDGMQQPSGKSSNLMSTLEIDRDLVTRALFKDALSSSPSAKNTTSAVQFTVKI